MRLILINNNINHSKKRPQTTNRFANNSIDKLTEKHMILKHLIIYNIKNFFNNNNMEL